MFGDKWLLKHGPVPAGEWTHVLMSFDESQISAGVLRMKDDAARKIRTGDEAWPPTVFEFACLCKRQSSLYFPTNMPPGGDQKLLTHKTEFDGLTPAECMATIRRMGVGGRG